MNKENIYYKQISIKPKKKKKKKKTNNTSLSPKSPLPPGIDLKQLLNKAHLATDKAMEDKGNASFRELNIMKNELETIKANYIIIPVSLESQLKERIKKINELNESRQLKKGLDNVYRECKKFMDQFDEGSIKSLIANYHQIISIYPSLLSSGYLKESIEKYTIDSYSVDSIREYLKKVFDKEIEKARPNIDILLEILRLEDVSLDLHIENLDKLFCIGLKNSAFDLLDILIPILEVYSNENSILDSVNKFNTRFKKTNSFLNQYKIKHRDILKPTAHEIPPETRPSSFPSNQWEEIVMYLDKKLGKNQSSFLNEQLKCISLKKYYGEVTSFDLIRSDYESTQKSRTQSKGIFIAYFNGLHKKLETFIEFKNYASDNFRHIDEALIKSLVENFTEYSHMINNMFLTSKNAITIDDLLLLSKINELIQTIKPGFNIAEQLKESYTHNRLFFNPYDPTDGYDDLCQIWWKLSYDASSLCEKDYEILYNELHIFLRNENNKLGILNEDYFPNLSKHLSFAKNLISSTTTATSTHELIHIMNDIESRLREVTYFSLSKKLDKNQPISNDDLNQYLKCDINFFTTNEYGNPLLLKVIEQSNVSLLKNICSLDTNKILIGKKLNGKYLLNHAMKRGDSEMVLHLLQDDYKFDEGNYQSFSLYLEDIMALDDDRFKDIEQKINKEKKKSKNKLKSIDAKLQQKLIDSGEILGITGANKVSTEGVEVSTQATVTNEQKSELEHDILQEQYIIMEQHLWYIITWPAMIGTILFGLYLAHLVGALLTQKNHDVGEVINDQGESKPTDITQSPIKSKTGSAEPHDEERSKTTDVNQDPIDAGEISTQSAITSSPKVPFKIVHNVILGQEMQNEGGSKLVVPTHYPVEFETRSTDHHDDQSSKTTDGNQDPIDAGEISTQSAISSSPKIPFKIVHNVILGQEMQNEGGSKPVVPTHYPVEFETDIAKPHDRVDNIFYFNSDEYSCYEHVPIPGLTINRNQVEINKYFWIMAFKENRIKSFCISGSQIYRAAMGIEVPKDTDLDVSIHIDQNYLNSIGQIEIKRILKDIFNYETDTVISTTEFKPYDFNILNINCKVMINGILHDITLHGNKYIKSQPFCGLDNLKIEINRKGDDLFLEIPSKENAEKTINFSKLDFGDDDKKIQNYAKCLNILAKVMKAPLLLLSPLIESTFFLKNMDKIFLKAEQLKGPNINLIVLKHLLNHTGYKELTSQSSEDMLIRNSENNLFRDGQLNLLHFIKLISCKFKFSREHIFKCLDVLQPAKQQNNTLFNTFLRYIITNNLIDTNQMNKDDRLSLLKTVLRFGDIGLKKQYQYLIKNIELSYILSIALKPSNNNYIKRNIMLQIIILKLRTMTNIKPSYKDILSIIYSKKNRFHSTLNDALVCELFKK